MKGGIMEYWHRFWGWFTDGNFVKLIRTFEKIVAKILALAMVGVIIVGVLDLGAYLLNALLTKPIGSIGVGLIEVFGLFLNILIAFEILENVTASLNKNTVLELVIATALTAVARKIIIFDTKNNSNDIASLGLAVIALSISYWIIHQLEQPEH
jgi:uncharacterized membrane protein (DUF373 family)